MDKKYFKVAVIFSWGAFFSLASLWASRVPTIAGHGIFLTPEAVSLLGVTLLISLLASYLLPDFLVRKGILDFSRSHTKNLSIPIGILALAGLVFILLWVNRHILHSFLSSADEHSCYFLAECLRKGKLYVEKPPLADFFKVVNVGMRDGKWFSVYPPGWPLIWILGLQFNIVDWLNPVMSSVAVFFLYLSGKKLFGRSSAILGLTIMGLSPFFMFTAASYFSHGTCLLMIAIFLYSFLRWREAYAEGKDPVGWAIVCGIAVGYGLMTRYLTMAAIAGPFLLYHFLPIFFEWKGFKKQFPSHGRFGWMPFSLKRPQLRKGDWIVIGSIGMFMILILAQNYLVTGKMLKPPTKYHQSWERLGFKKGHYTPIDALVFLLGRIFYLMDWFAPAFVGCYLFLMPGWMKRIREDVLKNLFRLSMVFLAFAYFLYYSWGGNQWGPRYWWEGMPFLCIAVADWIVIRWRDGGLRIRKFLLVFVMASLATSGVLFAKHAAFTEEASRQRRALFDLVEQTIHEPTIVFIHGHLGNRLIIAEEDSVRNSPFLDGRILYAHDLGERNKELFAAYPDRSYYRGTYDLKKNHAVLEKIEKSFA
ncbi:MAG TPA: glycosyltransferase family 39 protein [Candidatus Omnitrophota bacterium]|nr:glycosyltransferase family 39 protein [Candidatus Omnitrophota bacterium]